MATSPIQRQRAQIPGALDRAADQIEVAVLHLGALRHAVCANAVPAELSEGIDSEGSTTPSTGEVDDAIRIAANALREMFYVHGKIADAEVAASVLRRGRLRSALLQLLVFMVRWERLAEQRAQQCTTASDKEQLQAESTAEEENGPQCGAPACGSVLSCRFFLLGILSSMLETGAEELTDTNSERTGADSGVVQRLGRRRRFGAAAGTTLEPGGPSASNGPPLSLLALDLGCALLRMHTLQCCSRQLAALCAWMGGDGEEQQQQQPSQGEEQQQQQQQRPQQRSQQREEEDEQQRTGAGAGQEQDLERRDGAGEFLGVVQSSTLLIDGLLTLAQAAVGVLGRGEGLVPTQGATAAAQHADLRRLSRRFLLLFASHLRDSHLLEHCARAAVMAAVGGRAVGAAGGGSASGEAAEGPGQGQAQAQGQREGLERVPSGSGSDILHVLLRDIMLAKNDAKGLVKDCMQAPAPASTLVGPAVLQALSGPAVVHLDLVLGLHALCTADGGPEYGMPVSYRVLPGGWKPGRTVDGVKFFTADLQVILMVETLRWPELRKRCLDLLGGVGPMLALQLRVCELAAGSAEVHGQQDEEQRGRGQGERGGAGRTLRHVMDPKAAIGIGHQAHLFAQRLLEECWEEQQEQQLERRAAVQGTGGGGGREAAGAGGSSLAGLQGGEALEAGEPAVDVAEGQAAGSRGGAEPAGVAALEAAGVGSRDGAEREGPDATAVNASVPPGGREDLAEVASVGDVAAGSCLGEPEGAAGPGGAAEPSAAVLATGALPRPGRQASGPGQGSRRPLSPAALQAFQVRWWRSVCKAAEHMLTLRLGPDEREAGEALRPSLAGWLRLDELQLPDPATGPWPPAPPPRLAAALDGGLLPCLERLMRRAARDPEGSISDLVQDIVYTTQTARVARWPDLLWLLAYGEAGQSMGFLSALASLLPQPAWGGGGNTSRRGPKGGPNTGELSNLAVGAMTAAYAFLGGGLQLWARSDPPAGGSGGSDCSCPRATCPPGVPPPGHCRLQHMLAHAARLLLPPIARLVCCHCDGTCNRQHGPAMSSAISAQQQKVAKLARKCVATALGPMLSWITGLSRMAHNGSGTGGSGGDSSSSSGSGDGCAIRDNDDAGCGAGSSSGSTGARATHIGGHALGDAGDGSERAASQEQQQQRREGEMQQQQQQEEKEATSALHDVPSTALRRFLFEEVQAVELLGTVLRHLPSLTGTSGPALVRALCFLTAAYPDEVRRRVVGAAEGCKGAGGRSGSSSARGGGGARKQRGTSGAGAGWPPEPDFLWPVELVRGLGPVLRAQVKGGRAGSFVDGMELLAGQLENWREGSELKGEEAKGEEGKEGGAGGLGILWPAVRQMENVGEASAGSMTRVLCEVLSAPAAPLSVA